MTIPPDLVLEDDRVRLEPLAARHLPALMRHCGDPALWEFTFQQNPLASVDGAQAWLAAATDADAFRAFAVIDKATDEAVGSTRFACIDAAYRSLEIGWTFYAKPYWRTGINRACKALLLSYAFDTWKAVRVELKCDATNRRSAAAIEALGATYEGTRRDCRIRPDGERRGASYFSILEAEWPRVQRGLKRRPTSV